MLEPGFYKLLFGTEESLSLIGKMTTHDEDTHEQVNNVELVTSHTWPIKLQTGEILAFERLASELNESFEREGWSQEHWTPWNELKPKQLDGGGTEITRSLGSDPIGFALFSEDHTPQTNHFGLVETYPILVPIGQRIHFKRTSDISSTDELIEACDEHLGEWNGTQVREFYQD